MSRVTKGASNLGKIALDYGMEVSTLRCLIDAYPELKKQIELHTNKVKRAGQKTLPPIVVNSIYETLGEP